MTEPCVHPELEPDYCEDDEESLHCDQQPEEDGKEVKEMEVGEGDERLEEDKKVNSFMLPIRLVRGPPPYFRLFDPLLLAPVGQMRHVPPMLLWNTLFRGLNKLSDRSHFMDNG
uniref:Uncharacterized protein n=1 Tax=Plectus sambesii TaxID=2011161 RepID=A0A914VSF4_9BILA